MRHTFRCNVINFVVHGSPVRKFADASEGVGHRHKLYKLAEESNNLIFSSMAKPPWTGLLCLSVREHGCDYLL